MRPRPDAAENPVVGGADVGRITASMRPRPDAAENRTAGLTAPSRCAGFNEAAARCRGKHDEARAWLAALKGLQ